MAAENFDDVLNKLRDLHDKEIRAWQEKVTELNKEKCCDAQRMDELFTKNQQLREQQKILNENVKLLENRLRAGLCDRCTVTQDVAKKKQHEYETSQMQSLQHISILVNEMTMLKKENKRLLEEVKNLQSMLNEQNGKCSTASTPDANLSPESAAVLPPLTSVKQTTEGALPGQPISRNPEQSRQSAGDDGAHPLRKLLNWNGQDTHRMSNTLHSTIAVVSPGSREERSSSQGSPGIEKRAKRVEVRGKSRSPPAATRRAAPCAKPLHQVHAPVPFRPHVVDKGQHLAYSWPAGGPPDWFRAREALDSGVPVIDLFGNLVYMKDYHLDPSPRSLLGKKPEPEFCWYDGKAALYRASASSLNKLPPAESSPREGGKARASLDQKLGKLVSPCQKTLDKPLDLSERGKFRQLSEPAEEPPEEVDSQAESDGPSGGSPKDAQPSAADPPLPTHGSSSSDQAQSPAADHCPPQEEQGKTAEQSDEAEEKEKEKEETSPIISIKFSPNEQKSLGLSLCPVVVLEALKTESEDHDSSDSEMTITYDSESNQEMLSEDTSSPKRKENMRKRKRGPAELKEVLHSRFPRKVKMSASLMQSRSPSDNEQG
ncbi:RBBP8 N-terminal-like protein [Lepisosteus oculatus]|uniref:RBBP8 N-terminal-like protein n=1 Tax=Lepisosteus oculatus TaxID=7918 RepID=UPI0035F5000A